VCVSGKPLQPSLIIVIEAGANLSEAPSQLKRWLLALPNSRLSWKGLSGTITLAYFEHQKITAVNFL
jgi:hypothetical protein